MAVQRDIDRLCFAYAGPVLNRERRGRVFLNAQSIGFELYQDWLCVEECLILSTGRDVFDHWL
jgi:hypothetical protein